MSYLLDSLVFSDQPELFEALLKLHLGVPVIVQLVR